MADFSGAFARFERAVNDKVRRASIGAVQDLAAAAQAKVPVDTGALKNSFGGGIGEPGQIEPLAAAMAKFQAGDQAWIGWGMEYAPHVEFGAQGRSPVGFARGAAQQWPAIVQANVQKVAG